MDNLYYLYRHIRLDKNEPFYIGIGKQTKSLNYKRAFSKDSRNNFWQKIINKTSYRVEIIFETDTLEKIYEKEKEFINLYGRSNLGLGTLCNLTDGGEGRAGQIISEERKEEMSKRLSQEVHQYSLDNNFIKTWQSAKIAGYSLGICARNIQTCCAGKAFHAGKFIWKYSLTKELSNKKLIIKNKNINQYTLAGTFIKSWKSAKEVEKVLNYNASSITKCCKKHLTTMYNYIWRYSDNQEDVQPIVKEVACIICKRKIYAKSKCKKCYSKEWYNQKKEVIVIN